jgi:Thiolase, N-terminal domain
MKQREIVLCDAVRAAISTFDGHLKAVPATELGAMVVRAALARSKLKGSDVQTIVMGNVIQASNKVNAVPGSRRAERRPAPRPSGNPCHRHVLFAQLRTQVPKASAATASAGDRSRQTREAEDS